MTPVYVSFFNAGDRTCIGDYTLLPLQVMPSAGQKVTLTGEFNTDGFSYRVSHVEHIFLKEQGAVSHHIDVFLSPDVRGR